MRLFCAGLVLACLFAVPATGFSAETEAAISATNPKFPTPYATAILGLSLTAIAVVGARVVGNSPNTMMYLVLGSVALTAVMVAYSDKVYGEFRDAGLAKVQQLAQEAAKSK
jgi:hypothetical protein